MTFSGRAPLLLPCAHSSSASEVQPVAPTAVSFTSSPCSPCRGMSPGPGAPRKRALLCEIPRPSGMQVGQTWASPQVPSEPGFPTRPARHPAIQASRAAPRKQVARLAAAKILPVLARPAALFPRSPSCGSQASALSPPPLLTSLLTCAPHPKNSHSLAPGGPS